MTEGRLVDIACRKGSAIWKTAQMLSSMRRLYLIFSAIVFCCSSVEGADAISSRNAKIDNVQLHYLTAGRGPATVILLHGFAETSRMWRPIIPTLAEKFTVIAPDLPGLGDSSIPSDKIDMI